MYRAVTGDFKKLLHNEETKWYTAIVLGATLLVITGLYITDQNGSFEDTFRRSLFLVVTIVSQPDTPEMTMSLGAHFLQLYFYYSCSSELVPAPLVEEQK